MCKKVKSKLSDQEPCIFHIGGCPAWVEQEVYANLVLRLAAKRPRKRVGSRLAPNRPRSSGFFASSPSAVSSLSVGAGSAASSLLGSMVAAASSSGTGSKNGVFQVWLGEERHLWGRLATFRGQLVSLAIFTDALTDATLQDIHHQGPVSRTALLDAEAQLMVGVPRPGPISIGSATASLQSTSSDLLVSIATATTITNANANANVDANVKVDTEARDNGVENCIEAASGPVDRISAAREATRFLIYYDASAVDRSIASPSAHCHDLVAGLLGLPAFESRSSGRNSSARLDNQSSGVGSSRTLGFRGSGRTRAKASDAARAQKRLFGYWRNVQQPIGLPARMIGVKQMTVTRFP
ncbi:unnamed protein product, partial [Protopolystoma xenopodis]